MPKFEVSRELESYHVHVHAVEAESEDDAVEALAAAYAYQDYDRYPLLSRGYSDGEGLDYQVDEVTEFSKPDVSADRSDHALSDRELHTVLAALRVYQQRFSLPRDLRGHVHAIATNGGQVQELSDTEIDALCERINLGD